MRISLLVGITVLLILFPGPSFAEAPDKRWYFGGDVSFLSTSDSIRSNAGIIFTEQFGDDGIPFTGDPNELTTCQPNPGNFFPLQDPFCDPRPDDLLAREGTIKADFKFGLTFGYQLTRRIALQLDVGTFKAEVGPIDVFQIETVPIFGTDGLPFGLTDQTKSTPMSAGDLNEIPISLSGIVRFRNNKSFRPYMGAGFGVILTKMDANEDLEELRTRLSALRVIGFGDEFGTELTDPTFNKTFQKEDGRVPFELPLSVKVDDAFEWHLTGGFEYFVSDRVSMVFDARYIVVNQEVKIDLDGEDQIDIIYWPSVMFHPDGSQRIWFNAPIAPNTPCRAAPFLHGCFEAPSGARSNPEGFRPNPSDPDNPIPGVTCPDSGDFDFNRQLDVCFKIGPRSPSGLLLPTGKAVVQGGTIDLTAFSVTFGVRIHL